MLTKNTILFFQIFPLSVCYMIIDRIVRSLSTMSNTYIEGFHSVAYVTISSKEEAETLAGQVLLL